MKEPIIADAVGLFRSVWNFVSKGKDKQQLAVIYICVTVAVVVIFSLSEPSYYNDTQSYYEAGELFANGGIDVLRTPIYPLLCHFAVVISPNSHDVVLITIHLIVFYISIFCFFKLVKILVHSRAIPFIITLVYGCLPYTNNIIWHKIVLTESLSTSLLVIFCYAVIMSWKRKSKAYSMLSFAILLTLVFLRPIFIFLVPLFFMLWISLLLKHGRQPIAVLNILFTSCFVAIYLSYCGAFYKRYGIFSTSITSTINQYDILRNHDLIDPNVIKDPKMRADAELCITKIGQEGDNKGIWHINELMYLSDRYSIKSVKKYIDDNIKAHLCEYTVCSLTQLITLRSAKESPLYTEKDKVAGRIYFFTIYFLLFVSAICFIRQWIRQHYFPVFSIFLWFIVAAHIFVSFVGAQAEYKRLVAPCMPILYVVIAIAFDAVWVWVTRRKDTLLQ